MPRTRLYRLLEKQIEAAVMAASESLASGQAEDFHSYKEQVGYIRGLKGALILCDQIEEEFDNERRTPPTSD